MSAIKQIEATKDGLLVRAPAKINLSLLIAGKRSDGFHSIETIMAKINWFDQILIQKGSKSGIEILCQGPYWAPRGEENLIYRAAKLITESCGLKTDLKLTLTKNIPAGTGLGSASSDAAATLIGLNKFLNLSLTPQQLSEMAARLGSDIAFFLGGPLAFCVGKGEKIEKIEKIFNFSAILILPDVSVSTKDVYGNYVHDRLLYERLSRQINTYIKKNRIDLVIKICTNMLRESCFQLHKELQELKKKTEMLGIGPLCLSGSGSAMYYIFDSADVEKVIQYQRKIKEKVGCKSIIVSNNRW